MHRVQVVEVIWNANAPDIPLTQPQLNGVAVFVAYGSPISVAVLLRCPSASLGDGYSLLFFVHITFWLVVHFPIVRRKASARWAAVAWHSYVAVRNIIIRAVFQSRGSDVYQTHMGVTR